jgi:hypothetical protein
LRNLSSLFLFKLREKKRQQRREETKRRALKSTYYDSFEAAHWSAPEVLPAFLRSMSGSTSSRRLPNAVATSARTRVERFGLPFVVSTTTNVIARSRGVKRIAAVLGMVVQTRSSTGRTHAFSAPVPVVHQRIVARASVHRWRQGVVTASRSREAEAAPHVRRLQQRRLAARGRRSASATATTIATSATAPYAVAAAALLHEGGVLACGVVLAKDRRIGI